MAEGTLFRLAGKLLEVLASLATEELGLAWDCKKELKKLTKTAMVISAVLRDAEDRRNSNNHQLTLWLKELKDVLYDVEDLLDDFSTETLHRKIIKGSGTVKEVRAFFSKSNQLAYSLNMGRRVKAIRERLDAIAADRENFQLTDLPLQPPLEVRERDQTYSFVRSESIVGRDDDLTKIVQLLLESQPEENVSIVPIVGIGGLGKTTLAKMVFNDVNHFELKMWVCVSEKFELKVIVESILEAATGCRPDKALHMDTLQNQLRGIINGRKYLLVLDDVWNENHDKWFELRDLLIGGARGSWIVITTRNGLVARITGTVSPYKLGGLKKKDSWSLLKQMAFNEKSKESNDSRLEAVGMEIVEECNGVPLALKAIGRVLFQRSEAEWLRVKNNVHIYLTQQENGILPILKLSYHHLPQHLRQCFAYCSLIPKDTTFPVSKLIKAWLALGFIQPLSGDEDLEDVAYEYFKDLVWRSFLECRFMDNSQASDALFTTHDLMRDLACSVAGTEYCISNSEGKNVYERTRHVSCENYLDSRWNIPNILLKATKLRSFVRRDGSSNFSPSVGSALASNFKYLRMLDLGGSGFKRLPHSIGELRHLRDLDLSSNNFRKLPSSLCRLQNLQTLDLRYCSRLQNLPRKTTRLVNLMHLDIYECYSLGYMPRGLGQLTCLRKLSKFVVGKRSREVGELRELKGLSNLKGRIEVSCLENAGIPEPGSAYLKDKLNLKSLILKWGSSNGEGAEKAESVFESLQPHPNLERLQVFYYPGSNISSWLSSITNLSELHLSHCDECKYLPPLHRLPFLKKLLLWELKALENVSVTEMIEDLLFPSLEELWITDCPKLKGWWKAVGDVGEASNAQLPCFPCLSRLNIIRCPNLTSMPLFPSVKELFLKETWCNPLIQPIMKMKRTISESSSIFPPFSNLEVLLLDDMEDLDQLPSLEDLRGCTTYPL